MTTQTRHTPPAASAADRANRSPVENQDTRTSHSISDSIARYASAITRVALGWVFLWAFVDKLVGLGFSTPSERAWLNGGSPTTGFLSGVEGTFSGLFQGMAGNAALDWLFMTALLGIGAALILGIGMRVAAVSATLLLVFMWLASLPLDNNPFLDDHLVYAVVAIWLAASNAGDNFGLGRRWASLPIVQRLPILR